MTEEHTPARDRSRAVTVPDKPGAVPLGARRLFLIGGLCVPIGLVAGPYLLGAQLLAVAGVVMVAVALSYRSGVRWFSRLSWVVGAAGALWPAGTAAYWGGRYCCGGFVRAASRICRCAVCRRSGVVCSYGRCRGHCPGVADGAVPPRSCRHGLRAARTACAERLLPVSHGGAMDTDV